MIILTAETDKLQAVLDGAVTANQLQCVATWRDITTTTFVPGRTLIVTNSATDVDIVGAPGASTQRVIDHVSIYNADTVSATLTVKLDANGTEYILFKGVIATGEKVEYTNDGGWRVLTNVGSIKTSVNQGNAPTTTGVSTVVLANDVVTSPAIANTIADVTGLSFAVTSGVMYWFHFVIPYAASATANGSRWTINGPATSLLAYMSQYSLTATTWTYNTTNAYDTPAGANATSANTTGNFCIIEGHIKPSANGTVIARFASEGATAASITAKAGAMVQYQAIA